MHILILFAILTAIEANEEFRCKPRPGCHLAKCEPQWPIDLPALLKRNEYPIDCVKTSNESADREHKKELDKLNQRLSEMSTALADANKKIKLLEQKSGYDGWIGAWTGMTYDTLTGTPQLSNGVKAPYQKWHPGYPQSDNCCNIVIYARVDWSNEYQHLYTDNPSAKARAVICQK